MGLLSMLDLPVSFLFVGSKGSTCLETYYAYHSKKYLTQDWTYPDALRQTTAAQKTYGIQIQRAFGLGFASSFIPGTDAFKSRVYYMRSIKNLFSYIKDYKTNSSNNNFFYKLYYKLATTPFYFLNSFLLNYDKVASTAVTNIKINRKDSIRELLSYFPLLADLIYTSMGSVHTWPLLDIVRNLLHTVLNPIRLVANLLKFFQRTIDTILEIGATKGNESSFPRLLLKGFSAGFFLPTRFLTVTGVSIVDSAWSLVANFTITPIKFLYNAVKQTFNNRNKEFILTDTDTLRGAKVIRKITKNGEATLGKNYCDIYSQISDTCKGTTQYLGSNKDFIYTNPKANLSTVVATSSDKARSLKSHIQFFKDNQARLKEDTVISQDIIDDVNNQFITF